MGKATFRTVYSAVIAALALGTFNSNTRAAYQVVTYAESSVSESNTSARAGYNAGSHDVLLPATGYGAFGGGTNSDGGSSLSASGNPTDTAGTATASTSNASDNESFNAHPELSIPSQSAGATAGAKANLAQALVGVSAGGTYLDRNSPSSGQAGGSSTAIAVASDTLHFNIPDASASTVTTIPITYTVDGSFDVQTAAGDSQGSLEAILTFGGGHFDEVISTSGQNNYVPTVGNAQVTGWSSESFSNNSASQIIFNAAITITGPTADVGVGEALVASGGLGTFTNFQNTGVLVINPPAGTTFTSDSGVFGTQAVPEPTCLIALAAGAVLLRRRRY